MTYATHRYLGTLLYPELRARWNVHLDEEAFVYGCVKPDVSTLFIRHPHFWKISKKFVFKLMERLAKRELKPGKAHRSFSIELGIVMHYVADFFTSVHNMTPNPIREHIEFEKRLHELFIDGVDEATIAGFFNFRDELPNGATILARELSRRHARYEPNRETPEADLREIVGASVLVAGAIMDAVALNSGAASPRPVLQPESLPGRDLRASVPDTAGFR